MDLRKATRWGLGLVGAALLAVAGVLTWAWLAPLPERLQLEDSTVVEYRDGEAAHVFLSPDDKWRIDTQLEEVDPDYVEALVALEDERFWYHPGVDPLAVLRAAVSNLRHGRVVSGASTISMQLVRILEPRPRTFLSKVIESFEAVQLELHYSKEEILENYLRFASFGENIEGMAAASYAYFGHGPEDLSSTEIATLLAVPQNPVGHHPDPQNTERLETARDEIAEKLLREDALPRGAGESRASRTDLARQIKRSNPPKNLQPFPRDIPHAAYWLRRRNQDHERIATTISPGIQETLRQFVDRYQRRSRVRDIHNSAVVVVEHDSGRIRGISGNFEFFVDEHGGQIPGFDVARSTGSLLKPLIYAQAIDAGIAAPRHLVRDVPVRYGDYTPENYNGEFSGLVRLEEALAQSLNVPFVNLVGDVGVDQFLGTLRDLGVEDLVEEPGFYGLSAAVGGISLTPVEAAGAFATLARGGSPTPIRLQASRPMTEPIDKRVFSRGASWLTRRTLARRDRPDFPNRRRFTKTPPTISWKTGTSAGHHDAWTAGFGPNYTVVVWMGNFDNASSPSLVGSQAAAPLFFDLVAAIDQPPDALPRPPHRYLTEVSVCAYSGHLPNDACPHTENVLLPTRSVSTERCPYHLRTAVDSQSGLALTPSCRDDHDYSMETFVVWPSGIQRWLSDRGADAPKMPPYAEDCRPRPNDDPPAIVSPPAESELVLIPGVSKDRQEVPLEADADGNETVSWFVDGRFIGKAPGRDRLWWEPSPGDHRIMAMDENGRSSTRRLTVR